VGQKTPRYAFASKTQEPGYNALVRQHPASASYTIAKATPSAILGYGNQVACEFGSVPNEFHGTAALQNQSLSI
jgi:hypothetical protein